MKKFQNQLKSISKTLTALSKKVESLSEQVAKVQPAKTAAPKKAAAKKPAGKKPAGKKTAVKKTAAPKAPAETAVGSQKDGVIDTVFGIVSRSRNGATISALKEKTGFDSRQLSNALYKLTKRGKVESKARGLYVKK